jgi:hypothetical protein
MGHDAGIPRNAHCPRYLNGTKESLAD